MMGKDVNSVGGKTEVPPGLFHGPMSYQVKLLATLAQYGDGNSGNTERVDSVMFNKVACA